jgi:low affinity Fe/Cu permease
VGAVRVLPTKKGANTMSTIRLILAVSLILSLSTALLRAEQRDDGPATEASLEALLNTIRTNRKALVAVNLGLSDDEAAKFWPVYDRYQQEIEAIGDRLVAVIQDYTANFRDLSNDKATQLVEDYLAVEADRIRVRRAYVAEFAKNLPGRKVARFYQIENKIDAVLRYDLAATIPVVEEASGAPAR